MPKYLVNVYEVLQHTTEVEAESRESALEIAYDVVMNASGEYDTESCGTTEAIATEIERGE